MASTQTSATTTRSLLGLEKYASVAHVVLRIGAGLMFMQHGAQKLFGALGGNQVELMSLMGLAGVLEFFGGLAIVLGLYTRYVAPVLALEMAVAYVMAHAANGLFPIQNGGEPAMLFLFIFLYLSTTGSGRASLDARMGQA